MEDRDVMGVVWYRTDSGIEYAARGIGSKYERLYDWLYKSSYRCVGVDFPWDRFVFDDPQDHDRLIAEFGNDVYEDTYKDEDDE